MTALVAILAREDATEVAAGVARRLSGQAVVIPYDVLLQGWPVKPGDPKELDLLTAKQVKLLTAGYVRAGFHVVLHGSFGEAGRRSEEGISTRHGLGRRGRHGRGLLARRLLPGLGPRPEEVDRFGGFHGGGGGGRTFLTEPFTDRRGEPQ